MRIICLDVGEKRIGVAKADSNTRIAVPIGFIEVNGMEWEEIAHIADLNSTRFFVLGLPRSNEGNETEQSVYVRNFAKTLIENVPGARVRFQDESLTSVVAEERLKSRQKKYEKGDIDAEAASIILQDFLERIGTNAPELDEEPVAAEGRTGFAGAMDDMRAAVSEAGENVGIAVKKGADRAKLNSAKVKHKMKTSTKWISGIAIFFIVIGLGALGAFLWARAMLGPVVGSCTANTCADVSFTVNDGDSKSIIANNLEAAGLINNSFVFKTYMQLFKAETNLRSGVYTLNAGMTADDIIDKLAKGVVDDNTFSFTILPGETIYDIKSKLIKLGYSKEAVDKAFNADYDYDFLRERPAGATLEGYLYGETHEFYKDAPVEDIIDKYLAGMGEVIKQNDLVNKYSAHGLSLFEGITLASIVQKEAKSPDQPTVAQVFLSRLAYGIPLGSDVTVTYALDTIDPNREIYQDNQSALTVDSCYNTRIYGGLPCGPISNPGLSALLAVASPTQTEYLYFLTGDDGLMYYGYTEAEHIQNIYSHCQQLCNVSL